MYSEVITNEISVFKSLNLTHFNDNGISAGIVIGLIMRRKQAEKARLMADLSLFKRLLKILDLIRQ